MINYILIIMTLWNKQLMHVQEGMDKTSVDQEKNTHFMYIHFQINRYLFCCPEIELMNVKHDFPKLVTLFCCLWNNQRCDLHFSTLPNKSFNRSKTGSCATLLQFLSLITWRTCYPPCTLDRHVPNLVL